MVDTDEETGQQPTAVLGTAVRALRATALGRGTHGVPDLRRLVEGALATAFPHRTWVAGRVGDVRHESSVGLHFTLLASADDDEPFELTCLLAEDVLPQVADVLDRVHDADVSDLVVEGRLARVGGLLRYDFLRSTLVLQVSELDPAPTARGLREQRELARARAQEVGLAERQQARSTGAAPLTLSLLGAEDDPAVEHVRAALLGSPYAVDLRVVTVPLQGHEAAARLAGAVHEAALRSDLVLLVRDRGRPLTLAVFDTPEVSYAVAQASVPVVAALGGNGERTVSDDLAHVSLPDGEAAARWVLSRLQAAEREMLALSGEIAYQVGAAGDRAREELALAREQVAEAGEQAQARAEVARRRQRLRVLAAAALVAVVLVAVAVLVGAPLVLLGLAVPAVLLLGAWAWSARAMRRGSRPMSQQDDEFATVLTRLRQVRDELAATSSPEKVHRLRDAARQLVEHGEQILVRHVGPEPARDPDPDPETVAVG